MIDKQELVAEYNTYYTNEPDKWHDDTRNEFAFNAINSHLSKPPDTALDVGCGNGHTIKYFADRWPDTRFTGLDISPVALEIAHKLNPKAEFYKSFIEDIVFSKPFDLVILLGVAEHLENLQPSLQAVREVINRNGICYMEIPNCIGYPNSDKVEGYRRINIGSRQYEWHLYRDTWDREFEKAGLRIVQSLKGVNIHTEFCYLLEVA